MTYAGRNTVLQLLWVSVGVIILLAAYVMLKYGRVVTGQIDRLVANIRRFESGEMLIAPMNSSTDELGLLDNTFYDMATKLRETIEKEQALERMKQEMMNMVSHDLRSPLSNIQIMLELMGTGKYGQFNEDGDKLLDRAQRTCDRILRLANDLLQIERLESNMFELELREISVEKLFADSTKSIETLAKIKGIKIDYDSADTSVFVDADRIIQVLVNLLSNAIKYSPDDSTISMVARPFEGAVEISVIDQGIGIPPDQLPDIFDRFKQVRSVRCNPTQRRRTRSVDSQVNGRVTWWHHHLQKHGWRRFTVFAYASNSPTR